MPKESDVPSDDAIKRRILVADLRSRKPKSKRYFHLHSQLALEYQSAFPMDGPEPTLEDLQQLLEQDNALGLFTAADLLHDWRRSKLTLDVLYGVVAQLPADIMTVGQLEMARAISIAKYKGWVAKFKLIEHGDFMVNMNQQMVDRLEAANYEDFIQVRQQCQLLGVYPFDDIPALRN